MEPVSVSRHNRKQVLKNLYGDLRNEKPKAPRFKIGDVVRINKQKLHFEKDTNKTGEENSSQFMKPCKELRLFIDYKI
ncbi:hypothetical protein TNCV_3400241 [Trichonephila clavipes]|nr:hypothetical protein TNCV_3400241 [Trichonephila clavipes]